GWERALTISQRWGGRLPLARLLEDAIHYAENGVPVTPSQSAATAAKLAELHGQPGFAGTFLAGDAAPATGSLFKQARLGQTLRRLARAGLDDFYRGELADMIAADLAHVGSPLTAADLAGYRAAITEPVQLRHSQAML